MAKNLFYSFGKLKTGLIIAAFCVYFAVCIYSGGSLFEMLRVYLTVLLLFVIPGLFFSSILKNKKLIAGDMLVPAAVITALLFAVLLYWALMAAGALWLIYIVVPVVDAGAFLYAGARRSDLKALLKNTKEDEEGKKQRLLLFLLFAGLLVTFTFTGVAKSARPLASGDVLISEDLLFNVGNANSFRLGVPPMDLRFEGVVLRYHFLSEMLCGIVSLISGVNAYNVMAFYIQPFNLALLLLCLRLLAKKLFGNDVRTEIFPWVLFFFGCASLWKILPNGLSSFNNLFISHIVTNINGMTIALSLASVFFMFFKDSFNRDVKTSLVHDILMLLAFLGLCFSKGPLAGILACAIGVALVAGLFTKKTSLKGVVLGLCLIAVFALTYLAVFSGRVESIVSLDFAGTLKKGYFKNILNYIGVAYPALYKASIPFFIIIQTFLTIPGLIIPYLLCGIRDLRNFKSLSIFRLSLHAASIGGLLAYFLFDQNSMSQAYFLYLSVFTISILSVDSLDAFLKKPEKGRIKIMLNKAARITAAFLAFVAVATGCFTYINMNGSGLRALGANIGIIEKYPYEVVVAPDDERAMNWLSANTGSNAVFATNRIHTGSRLEGISNLYTAFSGRQCYMEGFKYVMTSMENFDDLLQYRHNIYDKLFFGMAQPGEIGQICRDEGIDYIVFSAQLPGSDEALSELEAVFVSDLVKIYAVNSN